MHPLRSHRESRKLSLKDLATAASTTVPTLSRIENGHRVPSLALAARLSRVTGLTVDDFVPADQREVEAAE
jgi:transcriptional regulator with XRE-family HTH domain